MIEKDVKDWVEAFFQTEGFTSCMLIDVVHQGSKVEVFVDDVEPITFAKCRKISRHLEEIIEEKNLLGEKYTLDVSSPGARRPLKYSAQYGKHEGRRLRVVMNDDVEKVGQLMEVTDEAVELEVAEKVDKKRQKILVKIPFEDIKHSFVELKF